jgi:hypothetical protein
MEPEQQTMEARPPALIDAVVRRLVPPACREHVLGDLWERYASPQQYVADALRTLPFVLGSQIRRTVNPAMLAIQTLMVFGVVGGLRPTPDGAELPAWLHALIPAAAAAFALILRDAYRTQAPRTPWQHALADAAVVAASVLVAQGVLAAAALDAALTFGAAIGRGSVAFAIVLLGRAGMPLERDLHAHLAVRGPMSPEEFARDVLLFERTIRQRNRREVFAGVVVVAAFSALLWRGPGFMARIGFGLVIAGTLFVIHYIRTRGATRPVPMQGELAASVAVYRQELERQRDLLHNVMWWYLLPLFPGMAVLWLAQALARSPSGSTWHFGVLGFWLGLTVLLYHLNERAARKVQRKIDGLAVRDSRS